MYKVDLIPTLSILAPQGIFKISWQRQKNILFLEKTFIGFRLIVPLCQSFVLWWFQALGYAHCYVINLDSPPFGQMNVEGLNTMLSMGIPKSTPRYNGNLFDCYTSDLGSNPHGSCQPFVYFIVFVAMSPIIT